RLVMVVVNASTVPVTGWQRDGSRCQGATLVHADLSGVQSRNAMAHPAARFVPVRRADHDLWALVRRGLPIDQALIARRGSAAEYADSVELVHTFSNRH